MAYRIIDDRAEFMAAYPAVSLAHMRLLEVPLFTQKDCGATARNCTVAAITRLLAYYEDKGADRHFLTHAYAQNEAIAKGWGYHPLLGSNPLLIATMAAHCLARAGRPAAVRSHYFSASAQRLQKEIDAGRPLLLNIAFGPYRFHTLTVCGYARHQGPAAPFLIAVVDGWQPRVRWLHWQALRRSTPLSLTTCTLTP